jgi:hypothetical protein
MHPIKPVTLGLQRVKEGKKIKAKESKGKGEGYAEKREGYAERGG